MTLHDFLNRARTLHCIDFHELHEADIFHSGEQWGQFRSNPVEYMLRCDDATCEKIWAIAERRASRSSSRS